MESFDKIDTLATTNHIDILFLTETWHTRPCLRFIDSPHLHRRWTILGTSPVGTVNVSSRQKNGILCLVQSHILQSLAPAEYPTLLALEHVLILTWHQVHICCLYLPPSLPSSAVQSILVQCSNVGASLVLLGDMNARLGNIALDSRIHPVDRALTILDFMSQHRLLWHDLGQVQNSRPDNIQHFLTGPGTIFVSGSRFACPADDARRPLSDHCPFVGKISIPPLTRPVLRDPSELFDPIAEQFFVRFLDHLPTRQAMAEYFEHCCRRIIPPKAELVSIVQRACTGAPYSFHSQLQDLVNHLHSILICCLTSAATIYLGKFNCKTKKQVSDSADLKFLESYPTSNIKASRLFKRNFRCQAAADATVVSRSNHLSPQEDVRAFYASLYARKPTMQAPPSVDDDAANWVESHDQRITRLHLINQLNSNQPIELQQIDALSISKYIRSYPENKAKGLDGISPALLKKLDLVNNGISHLLSYLFSFYYWIGKTPTAWNDALVSLIPKKHDGEPTVDTRRPISVTSIFRRIFEHVLLPSFTQYESLLNPCQAGFRRNYSVFSHILILHESMLSGKADLLLVDLKQAYDRVDQELLMKKLQNFTNWEPQILSLCRSLYCNGSAIFIVNGQPTSPIQRHCGLMQGGLLSPFLFNVFINDLPVGLSPNPIGKPRALRLFADDIAIIRFPSSERDSLVMQDLAHIQHWCNSNTMEMNLSKSFLCSPRPIPIDCPLANAPVVTYLGIPFTPNGIALCTHLEKRLNAGKIALRKVQLISTLWPNMIRLYAFKAHIRSTWEYGLAIIYSLFKNRPPAAVHSLLLQFQILMQECINWIFEKSPTSKPSRLHYSLLGLPLSFVDRAMQLEASFNLHLEKISPTGSELANTRQAKFPPFPARSILPRIPLNHLYRSYSRQCQLWRSGPIPTKWIIDQISTITKSRLNQPPPPIQYHLRMWNIIEAKRHLRMATLIDDNAIRTQQGLGPTKELLIPLPRVRRLALQWRLNKFGHHYTCLHCLKHFTRSCLTECQLLSDCPLISLQYWRNFETYSHQYSQLPFPQVQEVTILDFLLNCNDWRLFGLSILYLLHKLVANHDSHFNYDVDSLEHDLQPFVTQIAYQGPAQRVAPIQFDPP